MSEIQPYKVREVAELMRVQQHTVLRMVNAGEIEATKILGTWYINRKALNEQLGISEQVATA